MIINLSGLRSLRGGQTVVTAAATPFNYRHVVGSHLNELYGVSLICWAFIGDLRYVGSLIWCLLCGVEIEILQYRIKRDNLGQFPSMFDAQGNYIQLFLLILIYWRGFTTVK
jgi:hypothetical protein